MVNQKLKHKQKDNKHNKVLNKQTKIKMKEDKDNNSKQP